jgi:hypothetical protein
MLVKAYRTLTIPSVIYQLQKLIAKAKDDEENLESIIIDKRHDIFISIDAILNRASAPFCKKSKMYFFTIIVF